jgi:Predicted aminopeptidases
LKQAFKTYGAVVTIQEGEMRIFDGSIKPVRNIIASYNIESKRRVIIAAHWDSRPYADNDANEANHRKPILGANDGASGVGVMLELSRQFSLQMPEVGVDFICFDLEDWGTPLWVTDSSEDTWCLGAQYWCKHPHKGGYKANYGILLDMVGAPDAVFYREQISDHFAKRINDKLFYYCIEVRI